MRHGVRWYGNLCGARPLARGSPLHRSAARDREDHEKSSNSQSAHRRLPYTLADGSKIDCAVPAFRPNSRDPTPRTCGTYRLASRYGAGHPPAQLVHVSTSSCIDEHRVANSRRSGQMVERNQATQTRMIIAELDFRIVQIGDCGNQWQAKAVAGRRSAAREPIEAAKNLVILAEG